MWVDVIILILSFTIMIVGILGSVLPILPGPLTSWLGLIILHFHSLIEIPYFILIFTFLIALAIFILDYIIPIFTSQKLGASKYGVWGATIGTIIGIFFLFLIRLIILIHFLSHWPVENLFWTSMTPNK